MFEQLVYVSRAAPGIATRDAYDIIRISHNRNSQFGLTGGLLFIDGHFVQVLEGDGFRLRQRYAVIAADTRHTDVQLRHTHASAAPLFPGEWMALRSEGEISAAVKARFDYLPGLPATHFDGQRIVAFVLACCRQREVECVG